MAVSYSTPQLVSASSNTATGNVTGLAGGKRILVFGTARGAGSETFPTTLTVGGVAATLVNVGGTDARISVQPSGRQFFLAEIAAGSAPGSGTQSCTITFTAGDRVTMWVTEVTGDDGSFVDLDVGETNGATDTRNVTSTATGQSLLTAAAKASTATFVWTTSSTDEIAEGGASGAPIAIGRLTLGAAGNYTSVWTPSGGSGNIGQIAVVIAEASGSSNYGVADETDSAVALVGSEAATYGVSTETDVAVALVGSDRSAYGVATETDVAVALVQDSGAAYGVATESDTAVSLVGSVHATYGLATEAGASVALVGSEYVALGVATESDASVALTGHVVGAWGIATEAGVAIALAAEDHATYGLATEDDEAIALAGGNAYAYGVAAETGTSLPLIGSVLAPYGVATETGLAVALAQVFADPDSLAFLSATDRDQPVTLLGVTTRDQPVVLVSIGE